MSKLVIAIDCDDVLLPSTYAIVDAYNRQYCAQVSYQRAHESDNTEWSAPRAVVHSRIYAIQLTKEYATIQPFSEAVVAVHRLASAGYELHMVTARSGILLEVTTAMVRNYFGKGVFTTLEHVGLDATKGDVCKRLGADVLIDDNLKHLTHAAEHGVGGLIWFGNYPWQDSKTIPAGIKHCADWTSVMSEIEKHANA